MKVASTWAAIACAFALFAPGAQAQMGGMAPTPQSRPDPMIAYQAGIAALEARDYREAIQQLREARRGAPRDGNINYALGVAFQRNGDTEDARGAFERSVRASNAPVNARLQLGLVSLELGNREVAVEQQTALQQLISDGDAARRAQAQAAHDQLTRALAAPATPAP